MSLKKSSFSSFILKIIFRILKSFHGWCLSLLWLRFSSRNFVFFEVFMGGNMSLIFFLAQYLLVAWLIQIWLCIMLHCWNYWSLLEGLFKRSKQFQYKPSSASEDNLTSYFLFLYTSVFFSCLIALDKVSRTVFKMIEDSGNPCLIPDFLGILHFMYLRFSRLWVCHI